MRHRTRRRLLLIALLPVIIVGIDFAARYWLLVNEPPTLSQFRVGYPAAYKDSPYYSPEFLDEQGRFSRSWYVDDVGLWASDFRGKWYNHEGRERLTAGQPANGKHTLYIFGSSTTLNIEVPDEYTIASYLQRDIGAAYRVVNLGASGMDTTAMYLLLRSLTLQRGDMVVFYDGITDAGSSFRISSMMRENVLTGQACNWLSGKLGGLGTVEMFCALTDRALPDQPKPDVDRIQHDFNTALDNAYALCQSKGAAFYQFFQPTIWSKTPSVYERAILSNHNLTPTGYTAFIAQSWPDLQSISAQFPGANLTHVLDGLRTAGIEVYLDYDHATERGNEVVARAMYAAIWQTF